MPKETYGKKPALVLLYVAGILSVLNLFFIYASYDAAAELISILIAAFTTAYLIIGRKHGAACVNKEECPILETEKEAAVHSLKLHLSEQRHDLLNLLQIVYGYTQLKKPEKVLSQINTYSRKMENIGAVYNAKCIKLADLLYTKGKEAEIVDLQLHYDVKINFEPEIRMLDADDILYAVDGIVSNGFLAFHKDGLRNANLVFSLKENEKSYDMELFFRDAQEGFSIELPAKMKYADEDFYWNKISRQVPSVRNLEAFCRDKGYELSMDPGPSFFKFIVYKNNC